MYLFFWIAFSTLSEAISQFVLRISSSTGCLSDFLFNIPGLVATLLVLASLLVWSTVQTKHHQSKWVRPNRILTSGQHHHGGAFIDTGSLYSLAIMEFDEQGMFFQRSHMTELMEWLDQNAGKNAIILTFNHGWRHNASKGDGNLLAFKDVLADVWQGEQKRSTGRISRPLLGVFIAWQGKPYLHGVDLISFWNRSRRAAIVAQGSVREVHARLSKYRADELKGWGDMTPKGYEKAVLVHVGHSFGAYMLYVVQAQALMTAAVDPKYRLFTADLVILINPAFAAISYLPLEALLITQQDGTAMPAAPVFIAITSQADYATKWLFKIGKFFDVFTEGFSNDFQRHALHTTIGHTIRLKTHELTSINEGVFDLKRSSQQAVPPFWIVSASKEVIPNHSDIFGLTFKAFLLDIIAARLTL